MQVVPSRPAGTADYYKFVGDCPYPTDPCKTNNGGCHPMRKCIFKPMQRVASKRMRCGKCRKGTNDGAKGCKGAGGSTSPTSPTDPCKTNNGGCDSKRKCTSKGGKVTCGNCPAGFTNNGAKGCTKSAPKKKCGYKFVGRGLAGPEKNIVWMALDTRVATLDSCLADILKFGATCEHDYFSYIARGHHGSVGGCGCRRKDMGKLPPMQVVPSRPAGTADYYKFVGDCPYPTDPCKTNNGGCHPMRKCIFKPMQRVASKRMRCGKCRKGTNDGAKGCKGAGGSTSPTSPTDPCKTNNGGCDSKRKCTSKGGKVTCGNCPAGFTNNGAKG